MDGESMYQRIKVLFICKNRTTYGSSYGLINSSNFIATFLNKIGISAKVVIAADGNSVDRLVTENDPDYVIIEALWLTPQKLNEILSIPRHQKRMWVIRVHSRLSFLANEGIAFSWLLGYRNLNFSNLIIAPNTRELAEDMDDVFEMNSVYLPNIYLPRDYGINRFHKREKGYIDIGCFGAIRPMKNHLTQAIGAIKFANDLDLSLRFHINNNRNEQNGDQVLKNLIYLFEGQKNHKLVGHSWLPHHDFIKLVVKMDMGMQVSFSETFNVVAADFAINNVPIIGSTQIKWMPSMFQVVDVNSTESITKTLHFAWGTIGYFLKWLNKSYLKASNNKAEYAWRNFIQ